MPPRPEGTDGSDFSYREVVEERYKRMAVNMSATLFLHQVQSFAVFLKLAWHMIPLILDEGRVDTFIYPMSLFLVLGNILFYAGKPRGRCVLPFMKASALMVMGCLGLHIIGIWKYHMLGPKTSQYARRVYKALRDNGTISSSPTWLDGLNGAEMVLDLFVALATGFCFLTFNNWVRDGMDVAKERELRNKATAVRPPPGAIKKKN